MNTFSFEKPVVWQKSIDYIVDLYGVIPLLPNDDKFGLSSQIKRAGVSISSNISEGSGRRSPKDKARFTEISYSSLLEHINLLINTKKLKFIDNDTFFKLRSQLEEISRMLNALHASQLK